MPAMVVKADTVTFNIGIDSFNATINNLHAGEAPVESPYTVGILYHLTALNGVAKTYDSFGFCSELAQPISVGPTYTYDVVPLSQLDSATAGLAGSASSSIAPGGIGVLKAARLSYLYDQHYAGLVASAWTETTVTPAPVAFQLAQWALVHGTSLSMTDSLSTFWIDSATNSGIGANAISLAQTWLDEINAAGITSSYVALNWDVIGLSNSTNQDLIVATTKEAYLPAPEPGSGLLVLTALAGLLVHGRKRSPASGT